MNTTKDFKRISERLKKGMSAGTFGLSLLFHAALLFLIGGVVLVQGVIPKANFMEVPLVESPVEEEAAVAPEEPELLPANEPSDPAPAAAAESVSIATPFVETAVVATMEPSLQMAPMDGIKSTAGVSSLLSGSQAGAADGKSGMRNMGSVFGSKAGGSNALTGYLYDLKQLKDKKPSNMAEVAGELADGSTPENGRCREVVKEFIKHWDEGILQKYYRSREPLSSYEFFIPSIEADAAPKAFGVDRDVKPRRWMVHYKGQVTAAVDGKLRFVGLGDDVLIVRFQNKVVFDGSWTLIDPEVNSQDTYMFLPGWNEKMRVGSWFTVYAGQVYDFEVLIGEIPGGKFSSCLLVEEKDKQYKTRADKQGPALPVFQTAPTKVPGYKKEGWPETAETPFVLGQ